ncbi:MAG: hypothetical protein ABI970_07845, partial [Chloroflexota bacterium]
IRPTAWRTIRNLRPQDGLIIVPLALIILMLTQFGTTEWENLTSIGIGQTSGAFWQRPEWLYPVVVISLAAFVGMIAIYTTRLAGSATLVGLTCLLIRLILLNTLRANQPPANLTFETHINLLPPLIALDLWYAFRLKQAASRSTIIGGSLAIVIATLTIGAFIVTKMMIYPRFNSDTLPAMIVFGLIMGLAVGFAGSQMGIWLRSHGAYVEPADATATNYVRVMSIGLGTLVAVLLFVTLFISTATPPTL